MVSIPLRLRLHSIDTYPRSAKRMKPHILLTLALLFLLAGCATQPSSGGGASSSYFTGMSWHFKTTSGETNLSSEYEEPPELIEDEKENIMFKYEAEEYLEGVKNDLKRIEKYSKNAQEKIEAVAYAISLGGDYFHLGYVGTVYTYGLRETNILGYMGYPEFPDFNHQFPQEPIYQDEFTISRYKRELLDFAATGEAYIEDGNHYIRNCAKDHEMIGKKGNEFITTLQLLTY